MKRISRRNFLKVAGVSAAALGLAACGGSKSGSTATSGSTAGSTAGGTNTAGFTVQYGSNPETLDPALNSAIDASNTIITIFEPLLLINENNEVIGGQAESWEASEDGLTWTFTMRDGLKWSDGTDLTAKDFEYSFKRMADPSTAAPYAVTCLGMIDGYDAAAGFPDADGNPTAEPNPDALNVKASDDGKTLTIVLSYPCSYFDKMAAFAAMSPVQQATVEANGDSWCTSAETFVSNGPYMITDWTPSERIVLTKNPNYVGGWDSSKIVSDTITLLLLEDSSASYAVQSFFGSTRQSERLKQVLCGIRIRAESCVPPFADVHERVRAVAHIYESSAVLYPVCDNSVNIRRLRLHEFVGENHCFVRVKVACESLHVVKLNGTSRDTAFEQRKCKTEE